MRRQPLALVLIGLLILSAMLAGCRRSAAPPVDELTPEEEATAAMQEAEDNTDDMESPVATVAPTAEVTEPPTEETAETVETVEPTVAPTPTTQPVVEQPVTEITTEPTAAAPTTTTGTACGTYVVQPGDNLFRIALRHNLTVPALAQANSITNPSLISVGQQITIPCEGGSTPTTPEQPTTGQCKTVYIVQRGDNLFRIALRFNYSQHYLAQINGIENPSLVYVGQSICIP